MRKRSYKDDSFLYLNPSESNYQDWKRIIKETTESCRITYFPTEDGKGVYPYVILPSESEWSLAYRKAVKEGMLQMLQEEIEKANALLLPEAKGFPLAYIFGDSDLKFIFVRKRDYHLPDQVCITQRKAYKSGNNNEMFIVRSQNGSLGLRGDENILIAETIISSGETVCSIIDALKSQTDCNIVGIGAIYERGNGIEYIMKRTGHEAKGLARLEVIEFSTGEKRPYIPYFWDEKKK
ncbi:MAG: hypothetical protein QXM64_02960 [Candidatus Aenigmatarchaeota archaeon]